MLLHKLRLINFKRYRDQEIFFQDGITGIVGNNGTGKSTIVEAILFALFGLQGTGIDGNYIVSSFAGPRDACEVRLDFSVGGHDYTVVRRFRKRPSSAQHEAQLYLNQKLLADTVQKVSVEVQRAIGMNPVDFRYTIYAGQKDLLSLLESRPGSRKEWFMQVLGIDYLRKDSMEALRGLIDECDRKYTGLTGRLAELDADAVRQQLAEQGRALEDAGDALGRMDEAMMLAEERVRESECNRERLQQVREQHIRLKSEEEAAVRDLARTRREVASLEERIRQIEACRPEYERLLLKEKRFLELKELMPALEEKRAARERLDAEYSHVSDLLAQHRERKGRIEQEIARLKEDEQRAKSLSGPVGRLQEIRGRLDRLKVMEPAYTRQREEMLRKEERLRGIQQRALEIRTEIISLQEKSKVLEAFEESIADYATLRSREELLSRARANAEQMRKCQGEIDAALAEVQKAEKALGVLLEQTAGSEQLASAITRTEGLREGVIAGISAYGARREAALAELEKTRSSLSELLAAGPDGTCPTCHQGLGDHFEGLVQDLEEARASLQASLDGLDAEHQRATQEHERLIRTLQEMHEKQAGYRRMAEEMARLESRREHGVNLAVKWQAEYQRYGAILHELGIDRYDEADHTALQRLIAEREQQRTRADALRGECGRLASLFDERRALIGEMEATLASIESLGHEIGSMGYDPAEVQALEVERDELEALFQEYLNLRSHLARMPELMSEAEEVNARIAGQIARRDAIDEERKQCLFDPALYRSLCDEYREAEGECQRARELRVRLEQLPPHIAELEERRSEVIVHERGLAEIRSRIISLGFDEQQVTAATECIEQCRSELMRLTEEKNATLQKKHQCQSLIDQCNQILGRVEELSGNCAALHEEIELLKLTRKIIAEYLVYLLQVVRDRIEDEAGRILGEITDGRYDTLMLDDDFTVLIHDMGEDFPASRFSGGEQDDVAIALRIALSRFLAEINEIHDNRFLIFDEIFGSQDEERRGNLIRALRTQETHFPQIFLISHIAEVQGEFSQTLLVELGPDHASRIQEVA